MTVITRFAPSPTGFLHIGGARTALFNWLFARANGGKFLLRIEDTDRKRSTPEAIDAILDAMQWLELDWDGEVVYQSKRGDRHREVVQQLLDAGKAYRCYCSPEELSEMRENARAEGRPVRYDGRWRDRDISEAPEGGQPAIRLKAEQEGDTVIDDAVQGTVTVNNQQLDDLILLRSDGSPTYMLSVVVDDHDMDITHIIRGDDHLTNAARQVQIYKALGWNIPTFAHIPLIHGPDGAKLSKRHGALGAEQYREMGYLPEAIRNYLLRLGWSHGDDEVISTEQAIEWFGLDAIGKSPARFDLQKLDNLNGQYIRAAEDDQLVSLVTPLLETLTGEALSALHTDRLRTGMDGLKQRAKTLKALAESAVFYVRDGQQPLEEKAAKQLDENGKALLEALVPLLEKEENWDEHSLLEACQAYGEIRELKLGKVAAPIRAALTGSAVSPSVFEIMAVLGKEESLERFKTIL